MGNQLSGVSDRLQDMIRSGDVWADVLTDPCVRRVDYTPRNVARRHYQYRRFEPQLLKCMPAKKEIVALFPSQTAEQRRVMRGSAYRTLADFNRELNARMDRDDCERNQVIICWTDFMYVVTGVTGNLYLVWAKELSIYEDSNPEISKWGYDLPMLVSTDGHYEEVAFYPLLSGSSTFEVQFMLAADTQCVRASDDPIYPCDTPPVPPFVHPIKHLSETEARNRVERVVMGDGPSEPLLSLLLKQSTSASDDS